MKKKSGISLIALIITIIVIIILAAIVIFSGLNTPDRANLAKFVQNISDFRLAVQNDFMSKKAEYATNGVSRSDAQIYYIIASGADTIEDINEEPTDGSEQYSGTEIVSLEDLGVADKNIEGTYAYQITSDKNVLNWKNDVKYYQEEETHWVTDKGDVFVLPGYRSEEEGTEKWYLNEKASTSELLEQPTTIASMNYEVGQYVDYHPTVASHSLNLALTGGTTPATLWTSGDAKWRILSVEGKTIKITPGVVNTKQVNLSGDKGYLTGAKELDNVCKALYSNGNIKAHSMTIAELAKASNNAQPSDMAGYDTEACCVAFYPRYTEGTTKTNLADTKDHTVVPAGYEIEDSGDTITLTKGNKSITYTKVRHLNNTYNFYMGNGITSDRMFGGRSNGTQNGHACIEPYSEMVGSERAYYPVFVRGTYYTFNPMGRVPALENVIGGSTSDHGWLASPCVIVNSDDPGVLFAVHQVYASGVYTSGLTTSRGGAPGTTSWGLLPVVTLSSSHLTGTGSNTNSSADPGDVDNPWGVR